MSQHVLVITFSVTAKINLKIGRSFAFEEGHEASDDERTLFDRLIAKEVTDESIHGAIV